MEHTFDTNEVKPVIIPNTPHESVRIKSSAAVPDKTPARKISDITIQEAQKPVQKKPAGKTAGKTGSADKVKKTAAVQSSPDASGSGSKKPSPANTQSNKDKTDKTSETQPPEGEKTAATGHVKLTPAECNEKLLQSIYQTATMFLSSSDSLMPKIKDQKLRDTLSLENEGIDNIADKAVRGLRAIKASPRQPALFTRAAAWMGIQFNAMVNSDNRRIAEMMMEGCTMGIYGCIEHIYDYQKANKDNKALCQDLMLLLEKYSDSMKYFLTH